MENTNRMLENANKVTFLAQQYPDKSLDDLIAQLQLPGIEINSAFWLAVELGFIEDPAENEGMVVLKQVPETFQFGDEITNLRRMLEYSFSKLALKEQDLEENYLANWTMGYKSHDVLIALKSLLNDRVLFSYTLTDPEDKKSTYTFYTLYENGEQMWGKKQFKKQPDGTEVPETEEPTNEGEAKE